jgi:hypothetical protein
LSKDTRFQPGQSGNPRGRPKKRQPNVSAFDIILDKTLTVAQNGVERELTIDEALELQTYQAALKGSKMAVRQVLRMIEKREVALARRNPPPAKPFGIQLEHCSDNADEAMRLLDILGKDLTFGENHPRWRICTWAAQAAISRRGRRRFEENDVEDIKAFTLDPDKLKWPRGTAA